MKNFTVRNFILLPVLIFSTVFGLAQTTSVTATITDSDGQAWVNGSWFATLYNPSGTQRPVYRKTGQPVPVNISGSLNNSGAMSYAVPDNLQIDPSGTQWVFTFCSNTSALCSVMKNQTVTGTTEDFSSSFSSQVTAPRFAPVGGSYGYIDVEAMNPVKGSTYFNVVSNEQRTYNGTTWVNSGNSYCDGSGNCTFPGSVAAGTPIATTSGGTGNTTGTAQHSLNLAADFASQSQASPQAVYSNLLVAPGNPSRSPLQNTYDAGYAGISQFAECTNNPGLSTGSSGAFDYGSVRDSVIWWARGQWWQLYTGAASATSPYNPTLGIAYSTDGCTWTKGGQVVTTQGTGMFAGAVFSPGVYYDSSTDELWVYPSGANTGAQWYSGPIAIGLIHVAAGADWTVPANYVWQNSGNPILTAGQAWEGSQGVYAPEVKNIGGTFYMFYTSSAASAPYQIGIATAPSAGSTTWTKSSTNPITPSSTNYEEPTVAQLENGELVLFGDSVGLTNHGFNIDALVGSPITDQSQWNQQPFYILRDSLNWSGAYVGSQSVAESPDGRWLMCYDGKATGSGTDARTIGCAHFAFNEVNESPIIHQTLTNEIVWQNPLGYISNNYDAQFTTFNNWSGICLRNLNSDLLSVSDVPFCTGVDSSIGDNLLVEKQISFASGRVDSTSASVGLGLCSANSGKCLQTQTDASGNPGGELQTAIMQVGTGGTTASQIQDGTYSVTCSLAASLWSTCMATVTWGSAFADTAYGATCNISAANVLSTITGFGTKTTTTMQVQIVNLSSTAGSVSALDCHAVHN